VTNQTYWVRKSHLGFLFQEIRNATIPSDQKRYHSKKSETLYTKYNGSPDDGYNTDPITSSHYSILSTLNIIPLSLISSLQCCLWSVREGGL